MLYIGEKVGAAQGTARAIDIALDPLEGTTLTAKAGANALAVLAIAEQGCLLNAPDTYMDKIAVGPGYPDGVIDLDKSADRQRHARSPRPRASRPTRSSSACSTARATPRSSPSCARSARHHADHRRRRRRRDRHHRSRDRRSTSTWARAARPRACWRRGAALRRRPVPGPAGVPQRRRERPRRAAGAIKDLDRNYELEELAKGDVHLRRHRRHRRLAARRASSAARTASPPKAS